MDQTFAPPGAQWQRVSPKLARVQRIAAFLTVAVTVAICATMLGVFVAGWLVWLCVAVGLVVFGWASWLIGRQVRALGYAERAEDLLIIRGIMFRRLLVVPYGRMQFVDVASGPIERWAGLATVQLHTASPATDAQIPGLRGDEATRLRDQLSARGKAMAAGL